MAIYLASINTKQWHRGKVYCTTVKPMGSYAYLAFLAPTWDMVGGHKNHAQQGKNPSWTRYPPLTDNQYIKQYCDLVMSGERLQQWDAWIRAVSVEEDITLLCYCPEGQFCHRQIIAEMIREWRADLTVILH